MNDFPKAAKDPGRGEKDPGAVDSVFHDWLTRAELAADLGLSVDTLAKWASAGTGPICIRIGSRTYYRRATVREWLVHMEQQKKEQRA